MTETLVFIFLLDQLPGNDLNKTFETVNVTHTSPPEDMKCNVQITDPLLQVISRELDRVMVPEWLLNPNDTKKFHAESDASFAARVMDVDRNGASNSSVEITSITEVHNESAEFDPSNKVVNVGSANQEVTGPEKTPMLVAIFETVDNVTAQTCAGTLLAPSWVLTSASCVHLLSNVTRNSTNATEDSIYTIIVNATDPLIDGTAHNVTQIVQYPKHNDIHDAEVIHVTKSPEHSDSHISEVIHVTKSPEHSDSHDSEVIHVTKSPEHNDTHDAEVIHVMKSPEHDDSHDSEVIHVTKNPEHNDSHDSEDIHVTKSPEHNDTPDVEVIHVTKSPEHNDSHGSEVIHVTKSPEHNDTHDAEVIHVTKSPEHNDRHDEEVIHVTKSPEHNDTHDEEVIHVTKSPDDNTTENVLSNATDDIKNNGTYKNDTDLDILKLPGNQQTESIVDPLTEVPSSNVTGALEINVTTSINNVTGTLKSLANNIQQSNKTNVTSNTQDVPSKSEEISDSVDESDADNVVRKAGIVLMRIHPPVSIEDVNIASQTEETNVTVYGWVLREEESEHETMHELAMSAQALSPSACAAHYNMTPAPPPAPPALADLCLASQDLGLALAGEMSWGGPVVTPTGDVLGVSRGDGSAPLSATPLAPYADWIRSIINTNSSST